MWAAAARPVILGVGAVLTGLNLNILDDLKPIEWKNWLPLKVKVSENKSKNNKEIIEKDDWMHDKPPLSKT